MQNTSIKNNANKNMTNSKKQTFIWASFKQSILTVTSLKSKLLILTLLATISVLLFLFYNLGTNWHYTLPKRALKVLGMIIAGVAIASSTVVFQTITENRILTPSIIGLDSLYLLLQTLLVFFIGGKEFSTMSSYTHYLASLTMMVFFAILLYHLILKEGRNVYFLLLIGIVLGTLFQSLSSFMQVLIDPNEFLLVQDKMFASFNNIQSRLVWISLILLSFFLAVYFPFIRFLDVLILGREQAISLGIHYKTLIPYSLIIVAVLTALATALVGPITFLGLIVANLAYEFLKTFHHIILLIGAMLFSIITLAFGQFLVEHLFNFTTTLSVIINFIGGIYFIYLLLRQAKI